MLEPSSQPCPFLVFETGLGLESHSVNSPLSIFWLSDHAQTTEDEALGKQRIFLNDSLLFPWSLVLAWSLNQTVSYLREYRDCSRVLSMY